MKIYLRKVDCIYGAPMGRQSCPVSGKCRLQRMYLPYDNAYDSGGAYWGIGDPLYVCEDREGHQYFVRALTRDQVKQLIKLLNPTITFYR